MIYAEDTLPETREVLLALWRAKPEGERLLHGFRLWNSVKNRIMSALLAESPELDEIELLVRTFQRIYREDFAHEEMERICTHIREYHRARRAQSNLSSRDASAEAAGAKRSLS